MTDNETYEFVDGCERWLWHRSELRLRELAMNAAHTISANGGEARFPVARSLRPEGEEVSRFHSSWLNARVSLPPGIEDSFLRQLLAERQLRPQLVAAGWSFPPDA